MTDVGISYGKSGLAYIGKTAETSDSKGKSDISQHYSNGFLAT